MTGVHRSGDLVGGRYLIGRFIGQGGMQFVYEGEDQVLGRSVAVKTPQTLSAARKFRQSAVMSAKVNHANVAKTLDFFVDGEREYLVEELVPGADMAAVVLGRFGRADPYLAAHIFSHLARGVAASHAAGVIHRDLKPSNVLVSSDLELRSIKITDFGIARLAEAELTDAAEAGDITNSTSSTVQGALPYMSPEAIRTPRQVTPLTDIWSVGAMMYQLATGVLPFGQGLPAVASILSGALPNEPSSIYRNPQFEPICRQVISIAKACMDHDVGRRPTASALVSLCEELCYPLENRLAGTVRDIRYGSWGFISTPTGDVFFNLDSYFGETNVVVGDRVAFCKFPGGGAWRAHPVIKIN